MENFYVFRLYKGRPFIWYKFYAKMKQFKGQMKVLKTEPRREKIAIPIYEVYGNFMKFDGDGFFPRKSATITNYFCNPVRFYNLQGKGLLGSLGAWWHQAKEDCVFRDQTGFEPEHSLSLAHASDCLSALLRLFTCFSYSAKMRR